MPFINKASAALLASLQGAAANILGEDADLSALAAEDGALERELLAAQGEPEISAEARESIAAEFLTGCGIEIADGISAEDALAEVTGGAQLSAGRYTALTAAATKAGIKLPEHAEDGTLDTAALDAAFAEAIQAKGVRIAAGAGAPAAEVPEVEDEGGTGDEPKTEAEFSAAIAQADAAKDSATANKLYAQMREKFPH